MANEKIESISKEVFVFFSNIAEEMRGVGISTEADTITGEIRLKFGNETKTFGTIAEAVAFWEGFKSGFRNHDGLKRKGIFDL